jgi:hypothetical protein
LGAWKNWILLIIPIYAKVSNGNLGVFAGFFVEKKQVDEKWVSDDCSYL